MGYEIETLEQKIISYSAYYFISLMILFRPLAYIVTQYQGPYPFVSYLFHFLFLANYFCVLVISIYSIRIRAPKDVWIFVALLVCGIIFTNLFCKGNNAYLKPIYFNLYYAFLIYNFLRTKEIDYEKLIDYLVIECRFLFFVIFYILAGIFRFSTGSEYMNYADAATIVSAILLYSGFVRKVIFDSILGYSLAFTILCWGSRGAFLSLIILLFLFISFSDNQNFKIGFVYTGLVLLLTLYFCGDLLIEQFARFLSEHNINSRTLNALVNGDLLNDSARSEIYEYLIHILFKNNRWILGIGLCGDRYYLPMFFTGTNVAYVHNLFLEIILDFGLPIGVVLVSYLLKQIIRFFLFEEINYKMRCFIFVFFVISFVQLISSRSYLTEMSFFVFIAILKNSIEGDYCGESIS